MCYPSHQTSQRMPVCTFNSERWSKLSKEKKKKKEYLDPLGKEPQLGWGNLLSQRPRRTSPLWPKSTSTIGSMGTTSHGQGDLIGHAMMLRGILAYGQGDPFGQTEWPPSSFDRDISTLSPIELHQLYLKSSDRAIHAQKQAMNLDTKYNQFHSIGALMAFRL